MLDNLIVYDAIYALAADGKCERALFGDCAPLAREAFLRSSVDGEFPLLWFELPLAGNPRFDLHVAFSRESLHAGAKLLSSEGDAYGELFDWYAKDEAGGGGLAFAYDVSEGRIEDPAIHVNVNNAPLDDTERFFDLAAGEGAYARYTGFENRLPDGWRVWYAGVHPGRPGSPVRIDCFVDDALKGAYADDASSFERDLRACGFSATSPALREFAAPVLESPFTLELQFDVMEDGATGSTLGVSAGFPLSAAGKMRRLFGESGAVAELMDKIEGMGLADERWRRVPDATFTRLVALDDSSLALYCTPVFVKLRMRDGEPLDAKVYLQAGASEFA